MAHISRFIALVLILGGLARLEAQPQSIALAAAPPGGFISVTAQAQAPFGASSPCYWVVPNFPIGNGAPSAPACTPPVVGSQVLASWNAVTGAISYDLLRTNSAVLPPAGIASPVAVATAIMGTTFTDTFGTLLSYTVMSASSATAVFLLDNQNQSLPQVRLTIGNATGTTSSVILGQAGVSTPSVTVVGNVPQYSSTNGSSLGPGLPVTMSNTPNALVQTNSMGTISPNALPAVTTNVGTARTVAVNSEIFVCSATCTVTALVPAAGTQLCVQNNDSVSGVITLAGIPGVQFETTARNGYKPAGAPLVSTGLVGDQICIVGLPDGVHYNVFSFVGSWS